MKTSYIALAVAACLAGGTVCAQEAVGNQAPKQDSAVTSAVRGVVQSIAETNNRAAANKKADNDTQAQEAEYPAVPAKYLRPNADQTEAKAAVDQLKENVQAEDKAAQETRRKPQTSAPVDQVSINTNTTIAMRPGQNVFIPISREHPNRLLTPFKNPQIVSTSLFSSKKKGECGEACVRDGVIYITTDSPSAVTAFITEKGHEDIAFSVTMVPQAIPPREVRFTLPPDVTERLNSRSGSNTAGIKKAQAWEMSQPYVDTIREALRGVALGQIPSGYNLRKVRANDALPTCKHPGIDFNWTEGQLLEGYNLDIYVGVVKNTSDGPVEFRNQNCGGWKTAAVTTWPLTVLNPGQQTEIYVVTKRQDEIPDSMVRKPLIPREYN
ncbi:MAG: type-F conjugative transfer system secretin TraK [Sutterellaceae bacterium]|nr:type-F conjugative transfer system secretin TraK [Sutterellaceae bacterium]